MRTLARLPIIRHARYFWWRARFAAFLAYCQAAGLGIFPAESDLRHLQDIWDGKA